MGPLLLRELFLRNLKTIEGYNDPMDTGYLICLLDPKLRIISIIRSFFEGYFGSIIEGEVRYGMDTR